MIGAWIAAAVTAQSTPESGAEAEAGVPLDFETSLYTGQFAYSIPIHIAPARASLILVSIAVLGALLSGPMSLVVVLLRTV